MLIQQLVVLIINERHLPLSKCDFASHGFGGGMIRGPQNLTLSSPKPSSELNPSIGYMLSRTLNSTGVGSVVPLWKIAQ